MKDQLFALEKTKPIEKNNNLSVYKVSITEVPIKTLIDHAFLGNLSIGVQDRQINIPVNIELEYDFMNLL